MKGKVLVRYWLKLLAEYFRLDVEDIDHVPRKGKVIILPNHSGFAGVDAVILASLLRERAKRAPVLLAHRAYFDFSTWIKKLAEDFGLKKAGFDSAKEVLERGHMLVLFPEGEAGNFKSTADAYHLQEFHTGFVRLALSTGAPVVPCIIIGAEESNLNIGNIDLTRFIANIRIPLPVNILPLPAKWSIRFLPEIDVATLITKSANEVLASKNELRKVARKVRTIMQKELRRQVKRRPYIYSEALRGAINDVRRALRAVTPKLKRKPVEEDWP